MDGLNGFRATMTEAEIADAGGKTGLLMRLARERGFEVVDVRLAAVEADDLTGYPRLTAGDVAELKEAI